MNLLIPALLIGGLYIYNQSQSQTKSTKPTSKESTGSTEVTTSIQSYYYDCKSFKILNNTEWQKFKQSAVKSAAIKFFKENGFLKDNFFTELELFATWCDRFVKYYIDSLTNPPCYSNILDQYAKSKDDNALLTERLILYVLGSDAIYNLGISQLGKNFNKDDVRYIAFEEALPKIYISLAKSLSLDSNTLEVAQAVTKFNSTGQYP